MSVYRDKLLLAVATLGISSAAYSAAPSEGVNTNPPMASLESSSKRLKITIDGALISTAWHLSDVPIDEADLSQKQLPEGKYLCLISDKGKICGLIKKQTTWTFVIVNNGNYYNGSILF
ncbi:hypothetical protein [Sphingopyxis sp. YR583]|uniref:hypothetical protein n=1 Tax=Sphingopyxis sp. YR583 TaxID=1881047 RepID=UPI00115FF6E7|nr:hypothetical protein [Sphingopyxis sp. YR583]